MQTIFEREFRREKNLDVQKRQAELKKPNKKDVSLADKKQAQMQQMLTDLEDKFFKHVADDSENADQIRQRADMEGLQSNQSP